MGTLYTVPAHPRPGDELHVLLATSYTATTGWQLDADVVFTRNGWRTTERATLSRLCAVDRYRDVFAASLGVVEGPGDTEFALHYRVSSPGSLGGEGWLNNGGANYRFRARGPERLVWLGDTHLRQYGVYADPRLVIADHDVEVYAQTYPIGAARSVTLFYSDPSYTNVRKVELAPDMDGAGPNGSNTQWKTKVPRDLVRASVPIVYWLSASDDAGSTLWDSNQRRNYSVTPGAAPVGWIGGFGSYRPVSKAYTEGGSLMNRDGSTSSGCWNHGVSLSSYVARAVRVYVPGVTDRPGMSDDEARALSPLIRAEAYTNAHRDGQWAGYPMRFATKLGNDFIYLFFEFVDLCWSGSDPSGLAVEDGDYEFKVRMSTDDGRTWFWRGRDDGPLGGPNLALHFAHRCSYFNDPLDCLPE